MKSKYLMVLLGIVVYSMNGVERRVLDSEQASPARRVRTSSPVCDWCGVRNAIMHDQVDCKEEKLRKLAAASFSLRRPRGESLVKKEGGSK